MSYIHNSTVSAVELEGSDKSCAVIAVMTKTAIDKEVKNASLIRTKGRRGGERKETARAHFDSDYFM